MRSRSGLAKRPKRGDMQGMSVWRFLPDRSILAVAGPEALAFLDKLVTQDLDGLALGGCAYAALLSPQGKIQSDFFVWQTAEELLLDTPASRAEALLARLRLFKLRAQVELASRPDLCAVIAPSSEPGLLLQAPDPRLAALGWRGVAAAGAGLPPANDAARLAQRIALGVPELSEDAALEEVFALEGLLDELHGVSFKKGCFPGQENVSRMKRRATTRKKFCRLAIAGAAPGDVVQAGAAELGTVRAAAEDRALALLRLDRALEAQSKGEALSVAGRPAKLDPPDWLILPSGEDV